MGEPTVYIGVLTLDLVLPGATSLKDKRQVLRSLKDRVGHHFNVSLAEIDYQDKWQRATLAFCMIQVNKISIEQTFEKIRHIADVLEGAEVSNQNVEFI